MSWKPELPLSAPAITIRESAFSNVPQPATQNKSRVDSHNRNEERFSKLSNGKGIPETQERDPESQQNSCRVEELKKKFEPPALTHGPEKPPQKEGRVESPKRVQTNCSKQSKGNEDPVILERDPETQIQPQGIQDRKRIFESAALTYKPVKSSQTESSMDSHKRVQASHSKSSKGNADPEILERGRTVEMSTSGVVESMRDEMEKILSEKLAVLQRQLELTQQAIPPMKEMTNSWTSLQKIYENVQALHKGLENMQVATKEDLHMLRAELEERVPKAWNTPKSSESEENLLQVEDHAAFSNVPQPATQNKSRVDSHNRNEERFSKLSNGKGIPETQERDPESQQNSCRVEELKKIFEPPALTHGPEKPPQKEGRVESPKRVQTNCSKQSKGNEDPVILERALTHKPVKSSQKESSMDSHKRVQASRSKSSKGNEDPEILERGRTVEMSTSGVVESMRDEMEKILSEKLAVLQRQLEMTQQAIPPMKEMTNSWTSLQKISENVQAMHKGLENMQVETKEDLHMLRAELEERVPKARNTPKSSESEENLLQVENHAGFLKTQRYKVDVTLNADTAHPRLEVSEDGKSVNDTGVIRQVPNKEERFDSHIFVLAKEGYTSGRRYWEVDVGKRRNWMLGVASESVARKGTVTVSPKNGFWVIGLADGQEYWAHTDPWTRLTVSGRPQKIGIFLNISANKLSFYNVKKKLALYTFTNLGDSRLQRKFVPFFSTGSGVSVLDTEPLKIVQGFDDDD